jgi:threonine synthase
MGSLNFNFKCTVCGSIVSRPLPTCPYCSGLVTVEYKEYAYRVDRSKPGIWRYSSLLPRFNEMISRGEGLTPLSKVEGVLVKNERKNPTGSYADRSSAVIASYIRDANLEHVTTSYVEDFTYSLTFYLKDTVKIEIFMEDLHQASFDDLLKFIGNEGVELALRRGMSVGDNTIEYVNPLTIEGLKTIIFEIYERRLNVENIVVPMETGVLAYSLAKGIEDLRRSGLDVNYNVVAAMIRDSRGQVTVSRPEIRIFHVEGYEVLKVLNKLAKRGFITKPISAASYAIAENLGSSIAIITMGFKPYKVTLRERRLKDVIFKVLSERGPLTAYEVWRENPRYTLRGYYKALKSMELRGEVCSEVVLKGARRFKLYKLC